MKVEINKEYNFKTISPDEGMILTDWDKREIKEYVSYSIMCTPMTFDEKSLYEITVAEDESYKEQQKETFEALEEAKRKEI